MMMLGCSNNSIDSCPHAISPFDRNRRFNFAIFLICNFFHFNNLCRLDCVLVSTGCADIQQGICSTLIALDGGYTVDDKPYNLVDDTRLGYCGIPIKASR